MKVLIIHNEYGRPSGEEAAVAAVAELLRAQGRQVLSYTKSSAAIPSLRFGAVQAFFKGVYCRSARREVARLIEAEKPDVVNVHNVFPLISPAVLGECRRRGVPVVMTIHNYRLLCPNGLFFSKGDVCERCLQGSELACVLRNCEENVLKSVGYALRNAVARKMRFFHDNVAVFAALTEFQKRKLVAGGFEPERIAVVRNPIAVEQTPGDDLGGHVAYAGRISHEKGIDLLLEAARACPELPFKLAGSVREGALDPDATPPNVEFVGHLDRDALAALYRGARLVVLASRCYEGLPMTLLEGMAHGRPVIGPRHGGVPEIIDDQRTGLLFTPGDARDLADKIRTLWEAAGKSRDMGRAACETVRRRYSPDSYCERLTEVFEAAIAGRPVES